MGGGKASVVRRKKAPHSVPWAEEMQFLYVGAHGLRYPKLGGAASDASAESLSALRAEVLWPAHLRGGSVESILSILKPHVRFVGRGDRTQSAFPTPIGFFSRSNETRARRPCSSKVRPKLPLVNVAKTGGAAGPRFG